MASTVSCKTNLLQRMGTVRYCVPIFLANFEHGTKTSARVKKFAQDRSNMATQGVFGARVSSTVPIGAARRCVVRPLASLRPRDSTPSVAASAATVAGGKGSVRMVDVESELMEGRDAFQELVALNKSQQSVNRPQKVRVKRQSLSLKGLDV